MAEPKFGPLGFNKEKLHAWMLEKKVDGVLFTSPENVYYTTGYPDLPSSGNPIIYALRNQDPFYSFLDKDGKLTLLCWAGAAFGIKYEVDNLQSFFTVQMAYKNLASFLKKKLSAGSVLAVEGTCPYQVIKLAGDCIPSLELTFVDEAINRLRLIKSEAEIERIRKSTEIIDRTVQELAQILHIGMTRLDLIREAKYRMVKNGADGVDHVTVAFGAANPEIALGEVLEENQIVTLDLGAIYDGYVSDNRRLVFSGKIPEDLDQLHKKLVWIVTKMGEALRPGITFGELYKHAFELYAQQNLKPFFLHVGHSIGLQVEEAWIASDSPIALEKNMVLNIELYTMSNYGVMVGDEETYIVTEGGSQKISTLPTDMIGMKQ